MKFARLITSLFYLMHLFVSDATAAQNTGEFHYISTFPRVWKDVSRVRDFPGMAELLAAIDSQTFSIRDHRYLIVDGEDIFGYGDCNLDIIHASPEGLENLYQYSNRGYTCITKFFKRDGNFYLLGGYGYWYFHIDLLVFDPLHGAWELVTTKNQPLDFNGRVRFDTPEGLLVLQGTYYNPRNENTKGSSDDYFLDWSSKTWYPVKLRLTGIYDRILREKTDPKSTFDTQNYGLFFSAGNPEDNGIFIIDKQSLEVFFYDIGIRDILMSNFTEIQGDKITYLHQSGDYRLIDVPVLVENAKSIGKIEIVRSPKNLMAFAYPLIFMAILGLGIGGYKLLRKHPEEVLPEMLSEEKTSDQDAIIEALAKFGGSILSSDEINAILQLDEHKSQDINRVERSRLIKKINEIYQERYGRNLISRTRSIEDKRIMNYKVTP